MVQQARHETIKKTKQKVIVVIFPYMLCGLETEMNIEQKHVHAAKKPKQPHELELFCLMPFLYVICSCKFVIYLIIKILQPLLHKNLLLLLLIMCNIAH